MIDQYVAVNNALIKKHKVWCQLILTLALGTVFSAWAANLPNAETLVQQLGISQQDLINLNKGDIVYFDVSEGDEKELAAGAAMYLHASPAKAVAFIKSNGLLSIDGEVTAQAVIPAQAGLDAFKGFKFKPGSEEEAGFLAAKPGGQFNLSTQEFQSLQAINPAQPDAASQAYQKILFQRWQAYRKAGLKGIALYDRGNGSEANPAEELQIAAKSSKVLSQYFSELSKAWLNYPAVLPVGAEETFFLRNRQVENRPTAMLLHRIMLTTEAGELLLARQFYAGHSYNSTQLVIACLPYQDGSLVFFANRTFTDQVAGFGSRLKHSIGGEQARGEMTKLLKNMRKAFK